MRQPRWLFSSRRLLSWRHKIMDRVYVVFTYLKAVSVIAVTMTFT